MRNFFHLVQNCVLELSLRPLLYAGGTGAATVIIYYLMRKTVKEADADQEEESASKDSGSLFEVPQDEAMISKDIDVLKYQESQLEIENLKNHVETLRETIEDMKTHMYEIENKHNEEHERVQKVHKALQHKHEETECERERVAYQNLSMEFNNTKLSLADIKALIESSLDQKCEEHQKATESFINLQFEKSNLMEEVETLKGKIQDMGSLICETQKKQNEENELLSQDYRTFELEQEEIKRSLNRHIKFLMDFKTLLWTHCYFTHKMERKMHQTGDLLQKMFFPRDYTTVFACVCIHVSLCVCVFAYYSV
ncbi:uncharacterized protein LOC124398255 [Silurus meridionalis]|uniref:uncharacterized protein LOC124398255 n=1 Tax=Silurus meridionalis TaxID=175797 RepID=UPI001EEBE9F2|nr:uncharacterized protein LOC124398255 [Silurus meridionalis]